MFSDWVRRPPQLNNNRRKSPLRYIKFISLSGDHARSRDDAIAGLDDDTVADSEARGNGGKPLRSPEQGDRPQLDTAGNHREDVPVIILLKSAPAGTRVAPLPATREPHRLPTIENVLAKILHLQNCAVWAADRRLT